jgi:hypothetical protein
VWSRREGASACPRRAHARACAATTETPLLQRTGTRPSVPAPAPPAPRHHPANRCTSPLQRGLSRNSSTRALALGLLASCCSCARTKQHPPRPPPSRMCQRALTQARGAGARARAPRYRPATRRRRLPPPRRASVTRPVSVCLPPPRCSLAVAQCQDAASVHRRGNQTGSARQGAQGARALQRLLRRAARKACLARL